MGGGLASPFAFAQGESRVSVAPSDAPPAQAGRLLVVAFRNGRPASGVQIKSTFGVGQTNAAGLLSVELKSGPHRLTISELEQSLDFSVVAGEETQVTVHLSGQGSGQVDLNQPQAPSVLTADLSLPKIKVRIEVNELAGAKAIAGSTILISGVESTYQTDANGGADIELVPGTYSISVFHPKYQTAILPDSKIEAGSTKPIKIGMRETENELEEVVVLAPKIKGSVSALVEVRRQSSAVTDVLGSEQMARQGDSDAASSLRRVTGLTLMNGKYVYVRGLGERYSGVQMNSFSLPSPEPARRVVPMDLFPTSILESVVVQKSYSPDLPGEFGGGVIQLQTRTLPEKFFFKSSLSASFEDSDNRLSYRGGKNDRLGIDDGSRKMPSSIRSTLATGKKLVVRQPGSDQGISQEELTRLGQALPNNYSTERTSEAAMPGMALSSGGLAKLRTVRVGLAGSLLYGQNADRGERQFRSFVAPGPGRLALDFNKGSEFSEVETRLGGSFDLGVQLNKQHSVGFNTFLLRHTTNFTQVERKKDLNSTSQSESTTLDWTERQLWTKHIKGKHDLVKLASWPVQVLWRAGWSDAIRDNPDRRDYAYQRTPTEFKLQSDSFGNRRTYSELTDSTREIGLDLVIPVFKDSEKLKLKVGATQLNRNRRSDVFRLYFVGDTNGDPLEEQLKPQNIGPDGFQLQNLTTDSDSYTGDQSISAQYAMLEYAPLKTWVLQAGARQERSLQTVKTFRYYDEGNPDGVSELEMNDVLPAASVTWRPNDTWRARLAYSETLARPDFRELSSVGFIDDESGYVVRGNPELKGTVIKNIDHRWEYYFTTDEYFSVGAFYKEFTQPVEVMFEPGVNLTQTFDNAKSAENYGVEFETRVGLRHTTRHLRRWSVLSNLTLVESKIELDERSRGVQTSPVRPLQGQSPYMVNFQLQYDRPLWGFSATALYNVIGERITEVGTRDIPDTYEQPFHQVDFVASKTIDKTWGISFRAKNLLDPEVKSRQRNETVRVTQYGRSFGVSLNASF